MTVAQGRSGLKPKRVTVAFIVAPMVGALAFLVPRVTSVMSAMLDHSVDAAYMLEFQMTLLRIEALGILVCAFGATIVFGLPVYYGLRTRVSFTPVISALAGGVIAFTPAFLLLMRGEGAVGTEGVLFGLLTKVFACGLIGGLAFWFCAFWRNSALIDVRP